jgi:hypothetical protein
MTLVVAMATADALVLAADRRVTIKKDTYDDHFNKIIRLGETTLGSATGAVRLLGRGSDAVRFDVFDLMSKFFADHVFSAEKLAAFEDSLKAEFANYCKTYRPGEFVDVSIQVFVYTRWNDSFLLHHRQCFTKHDGTLGIERTNRGCKHSGINPFGNLGVIIEIMSGVNPAFDDLRADLDVKRFVIERQSRAIGSVTRDEAVVFCPRLIRICHDHYPLLGKAENPISATYIMVVITAGGCETLA